MEKEQQKKTKDRSYFFPDVQEVISGGYQGPYPLPKSPRHPPYKRYYNGTWSNDW